MRGYRFDHRHSSPGDDGWSTKKRLGIKVQRDKYGEGRFVLIEPTGGKRRNEQNQDNAFTEFPSRSKLFAGRDGPTDQWHARLA